MLCSKTRPLTNLKLKRCKCFSYSMKKTSVKSRRYKEYNRLHPWEYPLILPREKLKTTQCKAYALLNCYSRFFSPFIALFIFPRLFARRSSFSFSSSAPSSPSLLPFSSCLSGAHLRLLNATQTQLSPSSRPLHHHNHVFTRWTRRRRSWRRAAVPNTRSVFLLTVGGSEGERDW